MSQDRLVYSSEKGSQKKHKEAPKGTLPAPGPTKMRLETKGRGGRAVTVLWNFPLSEDEVKALMKDIQQRVASGATFKEARVEFQGDVKAKVEAYFKEKGMKLVLAGA